MTAYQDALHSICKTPVTMVVLTLDYCANAFGQAPCAATGEPCFNTWRTCRDKANYAKTFREYRFSSMDAPLPFAGPRPYVKKVKMLPTELKTTLAVKGRVKFDMIDDIEGPATDALDPYAASRAVIHPASYWKKFLARNPYYKGRGVAVYQGFAGLAEQDFVLQWQGRLSNITISKGVTKIEAVDPLEIMTDVEVPEQIDCKLNAPLDSVAVSLVVSDAAVLPATGVLRIGDEFISYTGVNLVSNVVSGAVRGAFGSQAAAYDAGEAVTLAEYIPPTNPFDLLKAWLLDKAGLDAALIDTAGWDYWRDFPGGEIPFEALIEEPTPLEVLFEEVLNLIDCKVWYSEGQQVKIRRNLPNEPGRTFQPITDSATIIEKTGKLNLNDKSRYSRVELYWEPRRLRDLEEMTSYRRLNIAVNAEAESAYEYDEPRPLTIAGRFITTASLPEEAVQNFVTPMISRRLGRLSESAYIVDFEADIKDVEIRTGDAVSISTDEMLNPDGSPFADTRGIVVRKERKGNKVGFRVQLYQGPWFGFIAPDTAPDYDAASSADKEYGYIADDNGYIGHQKGYLIY